MSRCVVVSDYNKSKLKRLDDRLKSNDASLSSIVIKPCRNNGYRAVEELSSSLYNNTVVEELEIRLDNTRLVSNERLISTLEPYLTTNPVLQTLVCHVPLLVLHQRSVSTANVSTGHIISDLLSAVRQSPSIASLSLYATANGFPPHHPQPWPQDLVTFFTSIVVDLLQQTRVLTKLSVFSDGPVCHTAQLAFDSGLSGNRTLQDLAIGGPIGPGLVSHIRHTPCLRHLKLTRATMTGQTCIRLADAFQHNRLCCSLMTRLSLTYSRIEAGGAAAIAQNALAYMTNLETLDMRGNNLGSAGCCAILTCLVQGGTAAGPKLKSLDLSRNGHLGI